MVTPLAPVHTNGTTTLAGAVGASANSAPGVPSSTKPASWLGAGPALLTQPLWATK